MMRTQGFVRIASILLLCVAFGAGQVVAAENGGGGPDNEKDADTDYTAAAALIESGKYEQAIPLLKKSAAEEPRNADVQNYLGYAHRRLNRYDLAMRHYLSALEIKPTHRGANEYLGELYLELGQLAKAVERLKVLDDACFFGCEEYRDLKKAIAAYKVKNGTGG